MKSLLAHEPQNGRRSYSWVAGAMVALTTAGCALTSKSEPISPRYFSPERVGDAAASVPKSTAPPLELRLGRVNGASHLDERLVYRDSDYQLGYYEERRWTEEPDEYLRRRLSRVLFEERGLRHVISGPAPTLEVELTSFEEVRAPKPVARVQVTVRLEDQRVVRWEETLTVNQPITAHGKGDRADAIVAALGVALATVVDRIADHVTADLAAPPQSAPTPTPVPAPTAPVAASAGARLAPRP